MKNRNDEKTLDACIAEVKNINDSGAYLLTLNVTEEFVKRAKPGMFSSFLPKDGTHTQRRPFSIAAARRNPFPMIPCNWIAEFIIKDVGPNSHHFCRLQPGEKINITYPRGQEIKIIPQAERIVLVGGGVGVAPLVFLESELFRVGKEVSVLEGAKNHEGLISLELSSLKGSGFNYKYIVEKSTGGPKPGLATALLLEELEKISKPMEVIACGPLPMMKEVARICTEKKILCQVILESVFACSQGACLGCAVITSNGSTKHVCKDGPAFYTYELDWEKLMQSHHAPQPPRVAACYNLGVVLKGQKNRELKLATPVIGASGTQSLHSLNKGYADIYNLGAILTKGLTLEPRNGNPTPRVCETPAGMLNSIGLENIGLEAFLTKELPQLLELGKPIIVNINGKIIKDYVELAKALDQTKIAAIEVNVSCPNVKQGGWAFGVNRDLTFEIVKAVRKVTNKFLIVKLTPSASDIASVAKFAVAAGADAISAINTIPGMAIDIHSRRPKLGAGSGGLSGPAIRPIGIKKISELHQANLGVPLIGVGGIANSNDALEYLIAGASAVQIGTATFTDENVFTNVVAGIEIYMRRYGFSDPGKISGSLII